MSTSTFLPGEPVTVAEVLAANSKYKVSKTKVEPGTARVAAPGHDVSSLLSPDFCFLDFLDFLVFLLSPPSP